MWGEVSHFTPPTWGGYGEAGGEVLLPRSQSHQRIDNHGTFFQHQQGIDI
jgi:hypothetical protein